MKIDYMKSDPIAMKHCVYCNYYFDNEKCEECYTLDPMCRKRPLFLSTENQTLPTPKNKKIVFVALKIDQDDIKKN